MKERNIFSSDQGTNIEKFLLNRENSAYNEAEKSKIETNESMKDLIVTG
jgi:hypothetical protein